MKTCNVNAFSVNKRWVCVDAAGQPLGRLAAEIARVLRGKHKPTFTPHLDTGDNVIVVNAAQIKLTGQKLDKKKYYRHSGYIGGIYETSARELLSQKPERMITFAVRGMLPKSTLGRHLAKNLRVFAGPDHNLAAQKPEPMPTRSLTREDKR